MRSESRGVKAVEAASSACLVFEGGNGSDAHFTTEGSELARYALDPESSTDELSSSIPFKREDWGAVLDLLLWSES